MAWSKRQKYLVHLYPQLAGLADVERRRVLSDATGQASAADPRLTQRDFDRVMAQYEALLDYRVQEGFVPAPPKSKIPNIRHWRNRLAGPGEMNTRLRHKMLGLWKRLIPFLPPEERNFRYLGRIASKACGQRDNEIWELKAWQAGLTIEALKDRLSYALSS